MKKLILLITAVIFLSSCGAADVLSEKETALAAELETLRSENNSLSEKNTKLQNDISSLKSSLSQSKTDLTAANEEIERLKKQLSDVIKEMLASYENDTQEEPPVDDAGNVSNEKPFEWVRENIVGVSDKNIDDIFSDWFMNEGNIARTIKDDKSGNFRITIISAEGAEPQDYARSYYNKCFASDKEIHFLVNLSTEITARIVHSSFYLTVTVFEHVEDEEYYINKLCSGRHIATYFVYLDDGGIEWVE